MKLWFEDSRGNKKIIANCKNLQEANIKINKFIEETNEKMAYVKPDWTPFIRYYTRIWVQKNGYTHIDIGLPNGFFVWEG